MNLFYGIYLLICFTYLPRGELFPGIMFIYSLFVWTFGIVHRSIISHSYWIFFRIFIWSYGPVNPIDPIVNRDIKPEIRGPRAEGWGPKNRIL